MGEFKSEIAMLSERLDESQNEGMASTIHFELAYLECK